MVKCDWPAGCADPIYASGLCGRHYREQRKARLAEAECSEESCGRPVFARGWCQKHYQRQYTGKPMEPMPAPPVIGPPRPPTVEQPFRCRGHQAGDGAHSTWRSWP